MKKKKPEFKLFYLCVFGTPSWIQKIRFIQIQIHFPHHFYTHFGFSFAKFSSQDGASDFWRGGKNPNQNFRFQLETYFYFRQQNSDLNLSALDQTKNFHFNRKLRIEFKLSWNLAIFEEHVLKFRFQFQSQFQFYHHQQNTA